MKISVFGLGCVGIVSAACFAKLGHRVIGVDIINSKVDSVNKGISPLEEKGLRSLVREQVMKRNLKATKDVRHAILNTEISFVCVGTPSMKNGDLNLSYLEKVCSEIGEAIKQKKYHLIIIRSTMFPGSLKILTKILEEKSGKREGRGFDIATNPEFLREGTAIKDFFNPPYIVMGADNERIIKRILEPYKNLKSKKFVVKTDVAQMIKYVNNSWHALKITFANEIGSICNGLGINSKNLMRLFVKDTQLNISPYYLMPGFAYGGSCLSKDNSAIKKRAKQLNLRTPLLNSISKSNFEQINRAISLIESQNRKKIGVLGLTFKPNTDDIRGNPLLIILRNLLRKDYSIKIFDKLVNQTNLEGSSEDYRDEVFNPIFQKNLKVGVNKISNLFSDMEEVLNQDLIIVSNRDLSLKKVLQKLSKKKIIIDLQNLFEAKDFDAEYIHL